MVAIKKAILSMILILIFVCSAWAADVKITELTADTSPTSDDLTITVDAPGGTAANKKVTFADIADLILNIFGDGTMRIGSSNGTLTILGAGTGNDEGLNFDFNTTAQTVIVQSSSGVATINFSSIALQESGVAVLNNNEIDASSELLAIMDDETGSASGTPLLVFNQNPSFSGITIADAQTLTFDEAAANPDDADVTLGAVDGVLTIAAANGANNENITIDLDAASNVVTFNSGTSAVFTFTPAVTISGSVTASGTVGVATSLNPDAANGATLGTTALEWTSLYLADGGIIYGQVNQGNTITSVATAGWKFSGITNFNECKTITNPSDSDLLLFWIVKSAFTASKITGIAVGGTSVVIDIHECDSDGTSNCADISTNPVTVDLDGANTTTFDNGGIDAGDVLLIDIGAVTGAVTQVMVCVEGN